MALDANIILQGRMPQIADPLEMQQKAMTLKQLAMQNQALEQKSNEASAMRDLLKKNVITGPDGKTSLDQNATMADLYKVSPERAMEYQKMFQGQNLETMKFHTTAAKDLAWSATPETWAQTKQKALQLGLPNAEKLPDQWSDEFSNRWKMGTLSGEEQIKKMESDREYGLKEKTYGLSETKSKSDQATANLGLEKTRAEIGKIKSDTGKTGKGAGGSEGFKALDKDYAKAYNDWTSTGKPSLDKNITLLETAKAALRSDPSLTGSIRGMMPDFVRNNTNEQAISVRDRVRQAAQGALKATLGSAFTEKEGERIMNQAYNEKLSPEENIRKIDIALDELKAHEKNNDRKAAYFQQRGTLSGLDTTTAPKTQGQISSDFIRMTDAKGGSFNIPKDQYGEAIAAGLKKGG